MRSLRLVAGCLVLLLEGCRVTGGGREAPRIPELKGEAERAALEAAVDSLRVRARELVADTIRRTGERLGRPDPDPGEVRVEVELGLGRRTPSGWGAARTSGWGRSMKIQLGAETFLSGDGELELTARHEAIHAYFRRQLGWWRYSGLPAWVQEGLAIHLAGQTWEKVVDLVYWDSEHPEAELAGLEARESLNQYAEYGLAFEFVEGFPGGVEAVARRILDGEGHYEAIGVVTGLGRPAFLKAARADAESRLRAVVLGLPAAYREGVALVPRKGKKDIEGARARFERVLQEAGIDPAGVHGPGDLPEELGIGPLFALVRWASLAGYPWGSGEAVPALRALLSLPPQRRGARTHYLRYYLARALESDGRSDEALAEYLFLARLHTESPSYQSDAALRVARILFARGRYQEALEWFEGVPEKEIRGDVNVRYEMGLTLYHAGRREEAMRVLQDLTADDSPYRAVIELARKKLEAMKSSSLRREDPPY